jgi:hypothetical protein
MRQQDERLAALDVDPWRRVRTWREHDEVVGLVYDLRHAQVEEQQSARLRERLRQCERELEAQRHAGERGGGGGE